MLGSHWEERRDINEAKKELINLLIFEAYIYSGHRITLEGIQLREEIHFLP